MAARLFVVGLVAAGCATPPSPRPEAAVKQYLAALDRDDPHAAYLLLLPSLRARIAESDFAKRWQASPEERRAQADHLRVTLLATTRPPIDEWAAVVFADGARVPLGRERAEWRLGTTDLGELHAATPGEALALLSRALDARRFDLLLNLLADPLKGEVERQLRERLDRLKAALERTRDLDVTGDRARLLYGSGFHIDLRRQEGEWRIYDLN